MILDMQVQKVTSKGDALVADAARASFNRQSTSYSTEQNLRLLEFLANAEPAHWTPFGHVRVSMRIPEEDIDWGCILNEPNLMAGLVRRHGTLTHSLWGWKQMLQSGVFRDNSHVLKRLNALKGSDSALHALGLMQTETVEGSSVHYSTNDVTLRITCPIVIARQLFKHTVGFVYSEASGRYIDYEGQHLPWQWSSKPSNAKQGAGAPAGRFKSFLATTLTRASYSVANGCNWLLRKALGIAPEQARYCMPMSTSTTFVVTADKLAWSRLLKQRIHPDAQREIQVLANMIKSEL